jgi:hypothetical protein
MRALPRSLSIEEVSEMRKNRIIFAIRLAIGGAALGLAFSNIIGSFLGVDIGARGELLGAGVGGGVSFAVLAKAMHIFG